LRVVFQVACQEKFSWRIFFIEATTRSECKSFKILDFENIVSSSVEGVSLSGEEIEELLESVNQFINLEICGFRDLSAIIGFHNKNDLSEIADIRIEMVDSSYWEISCLDDEANTSLLKKIVDEVFLLGASPELPL
jgi:hypothetical protein